MQQIILASKSPRRKRILEQVGVKFTVDVSEFDEESVSFKSSKEMVEKLSLEKAKVVAKRHADAIIIAADTTVVMEGEIIGKPKSVADAKRILRKFSGKTHTVITGFTIIGGKKTLTDSVASKVKFKKLTKDEIDVYVATGEPMDKAGGYGIQDKAGLFIEAIEGDYFNVVGLPLLAVSEALKKFGVNIIKSW
jgi:septum formation protein